MRIAELLETKRQRGEKAFIAYLTAGDPSLSATPRLVRALARGGADIVELGVPHSDPVADGPTNLRSAERALRAGASLSNILAMVAELRREGVQVPLVLFSYFNPILRLGCEAFAKQARLAGADGALVVDLPPEEAGEYRRAMDTAKLGTVFLASPTTTAERLGLIDQSSTAFVYYVSRTGVTGVRNEVSGSLATELAKVKRSVGRSICVGFGLSTPRQICEVAPLADGVIVGSAIVNLIESSGSVEAAEKSLECFTREMVAALRGIGK